MCSLWRQILRSPQWWLTLVMLVLLTMLGYANGVAATLPQAVETTRPDNFSCGTVTEISQIECEALVALYANTNGPSWTNQSGWLTTTTPCNWQGITCQANQVKRLDLSNNGLTGVIPPALANLTALQKLWLSYNRLSGPIPPELGNLANLQLLHLVGNQLTGSIPPQLGNLTQLYQLSLDANALSGPLPPELGNLARLRELRLTYNQLSGGIPVALGNLTDLQGLMLAHNRLEGALPPELGKLTNLQLADFTGNQFRGAIPPQLVNWGTMDHLKFDYNALTATDDAALLAWLPEEAPEWGATQTVPPFYPTLSTSDNQMVLAWIPITYTGDEGYYEIWYSQTADGPWMIHGTTIDKTARSYILTGLIPDSLYFVRLRTYSHTSINTFIFSDFSPAISSRRISDCRDITEIPQSECDALIAFYTRTNGPAWIIQSGWLRNLEPCSWGGVTCESGHVTKLYRGGFHSELRGSIPSELANLTHLQELGLGENFYSLSGNIPPELGRLTELKVLKLYRNNLSGSIPSALGNLVNLQELDIRENQLSGPIPPELGNLMNLEELVLSENNLSGTIPSTIGNLIKLRSLHLYANQIEGMLSPSLANLKQLEILNLSNNRLTGEIPTTLESLKNLWYLALDNNQLSGMIPAELGSMSNLQILNLYYNQLSGPIPSTLGNMRSLGTLTLDGNRLVGTIPPQLGDLSNLWSLGLSSNQLSGAIPEELSRLTKLSRLDVSYNALYAIDTPLLTWLALREPNWATTQTVPPTNLVAEWQNIGIIRVSWTPILYTSDGGYYEISYATQLSGPFMIHGVTASKSTTNYTLTGLAPNTTYYIRLRTYTPTHVVNQNDLWSDYSPVVSTGGGTTNLLVNGTFEVGTIPWLFTTNGVGTLTTTGPAYEGNAAAELAITQKGANTQLYQTGFPLEPKTRYRLTLAARSSRGQDLALYLQQAASPNANYGLRNFRLNLTRDWKQFTVEFVTKGFKQPTTDTQLRLWLQPYVATGDRYWLDAISLTKVNVSAIAAQTEQGESGTITGTVQLPSTLTGPVTLTLVDLESEGALFTQMVTAAADGTFAFGVVPAGTYELRAIGPAGTLPPEPYQLLVDETPAESLDFVFEVATDTLYLPLINR